MRKVGPEEIVSTSSYYRIEAVQQFEDVRSRAQFCRIGMRLLKLPLNLLPFAPIYDRLSATNGIPLGIQEISVAQIVGSLGRARDYDRHFRPLQDGQRDRWVNSWILHKTKGWDPITVRQIGNLYFVEDGHHRTSVAHTSRLTAITADVIAYPVPMQFDTHASLQAILMHLEESAAATFIPVAQGRAKA